MDAEYRKVWSRSRDELLQAVTALIITLVLGWANASSNETGIQQKHVNKNPYSAKNSDYSK